MSGHFPAGLAFARGDRARDRQARAGRPPDAAATASATRCCPRRSRCRCSPATRCPPWPTPPRKSCSCCRSAGSRCSHYTPVDRRRGRPADAGRGRVLPAERARLPVRRRRLRGGDAPTSGRAVGLVVASALMVDYTLTVAVSVSSGVANLASAFPVLDSLRHADRRAGGGDHRADQPARRARVRHRVRDPHLLLHRRGRADDRLGPDPAGRSAITCRPRARTTRSRSAKRVHRAGPGLPAAARVLLRLHRADRGRGDQQRRARVQASPRARTPPPRWPCWACIAVAMFAGVTALALVSHVHCGPRPGPDRPARGPGPSAP